MGLIETENEAYVCGAIMIDGAQVLQAIRGILPPGAFQLEAYRAIYTAGLSLLDAGEPIDAVAIRTQAKRQGVELSNDLLSQLMDIVPTTVNCVEYATVWRRKPAHGLLRSLLPGYRRTVRPPLTSFYQPCSGRRKPSGPAATSGDC